MMRAVMIEAFGGPEVMRLREVAEPHAGEGQVRVAVRAIGVNAIDYKIRNGALGHDHPLPYVPGIEMAGVIDEIGDGVADFAVGDEVLGTPLHGAYAEYALSTEVHRKPPSMTWAQAAAYPVATETAERCLQQLAVSPGELLLIHAASGAVGQAAAQLARARGVDVIGTASPANFDALRDIGVTPVEYGEGLLQRVRAMSPRGVDAVLDASGRGVLADSVELAHGPERVITIADFRAAEHGVRFSAGDPSSRRPEGVDRALELFEQGRFNLPVGRTYALEDASVALADSEAARTFGKLVILLGD